MSLDHCVVDGTFPGAYVMLRGDQESVVSFLIMENTPVPGTLTVGCGAVSTPASDVLAAALAAATAQILDGPVMGDFGTHWLSKEEYTAEELIEGLRVKTPQVELPIALDLVHGQMAITRRERGVGS